MFIYKHLKYNIMSSCEGPGPKFVIIRPYFNDDPDPPSPPSLFILIIALEDSSLLSTQHPRPPSHTECLNDIILRS